MLIIHYVYECSNCVDENDRPVTKSAKEKRIIEKSPVTPSLLAHVFLAPFGAVVFPQYPSRI